MNRPLVIGAVLVILVVGIVLLRGGQQQQQPTATVTPTTEKMMKGEEKTTEDKMMAKEAKVTVTESGFSPETLTVKTGTEVTWVNNGGAAVQIASSPHPTHTDYPPLNLGVVQDGESVSLVFDQAGTYKYHNHLNPSQKGTLVVE